MNRLFFIIISLLAPLSMLAQSFTLKGRVVDEEGKALELASVACVSQGKATVTSLKGDYSLTLHSTDSVVIRFSMLGYRTKKRVLFKPKGMQTLQVTLYQEDNTLNEVSVQGQKIQSGQMEELKTKPMKNMPSTTGNAVEELIQSQAGVSTHSELSSQYNVRGGSFDENSVYMNNVEMFRPFLVKSGQQEGLSVINPDMVGSIGFSTGGYEARYGDKMSSALNIIYRKPKHFEATVEASLLGASAYVGIANKKFSWSNGLRYKTNRYLLGTFETNGEYDPNFLDYQTYLSWRPNQRWSFDLIGDISDNHYNFKPKDRETRFGTLESVRSFKVYFGGEERDRFRTFFGSLNITRHYGDSTSVSLITSAFKTDEQEKYDIEGQYWLTQTETSENLGVGTYFQHARNYLKGNVESMKLMAQHKARQHDIEGAVTYKWEHVEENSAEYEMRDSAGYVMPHTGKDLYMIYSLRAKNELNSRRLEVYLQDTWRFKSGGTTESNDSANVSNPTLYTLNYGIRFSNWSYTRESIVSPRVSLSIIPAFNQNLSFRIATGLYYQAPFFKELRDTTTVGGMTYATLNQHIKSQQSIHFTGGMEYRFRISNRPFKFTTELYYKLLSNLVPYSVNNMKITYYGDNNASGHAAGLDMKLYGEFVPGSDSWLTLSLMNTGMKLNGRTMPLPTDQRFAAHLFYTDFFPGSDRWLMTLRLTYADGLPFSAPHRELERNGFRAPAYRRADIGMTYRLLNNEDHHRKSVFNNIWLGVDCLNLFDISNVNSYYWITDVTNQMYAVPNYLTRRQINAKVRFEF
jgi:hypothetical protein